VQDFIAALRGLTVRGRCFISAGLTCCVTAVVIGEHDLLRVGLLLVVLPILAAAFVSRTRYRLACSRRIYPPRVDAGSAVSVRVRLDNVSRLPSSALLVEDEIPHRLGGRARFVVGRIEPGGSRDLSYRLHAQLRGRYRIGPMSIRLTDPFGLCELSRAFRSSDELVVAPTIEQLPAVHRPGSLSRSVARHLTSSVVSEDDVTTRPYQSGDDLRRVHWKTTARAGELMVRREEHPPTGGATVLLDTREQSWAAGGPPLAFEWAVSATGSIAIHLTGSGGAVRLIYATGVAATGTATTVTALLDALATVTTSESESPWPALAAMRTARRGTLVAVLGRTDAATAASIAAARPRSAPAIAVLADLTSWGADASAAEDLEVARSAFARQGWAVLVASRGTTLAGLWPQLPAASAVAARTGRGDTPVQSEKSEKTAAW
jgi:uncharacterized protein (DUF58 family)